MKSWILSLIIILIGILAKAGGPEEFLIYDPKRVEGKKVSQELEISYYGQKIKRPELYLSSNKQVLLGDLEIETGLKKSMDKIVIPRAPSAAWMLREISKSNVVVIQDFIGKKETFLKKLAALLVDFNMTVEEVNRVIAEVNDRFYLSANDIVMSNIHDQRVTIKAGKYFDLPQRVLYAISTERLGQEIPSTGGFYYMLKSRVAVSRQTNEITKHRSIVLDFDQTFAKFKQSALQSLGTDNVVNLEMIFDRPDATSMTLNIADGIGAFPKQIHNFFENSNSACTKLF